MAKEFQDDLTCDIKPDFTIEELSQLTKAAPWVFTVMELADEIVEMTREALTQEEQTPYLKLWSNLIDLDKNKKLMGLEDPRNQVPMSYFFPLEASDQYWKTLDALMNYASFASRSWEDDLAATWRISCRMFAATVGTHSVEG